MNFSLPAVWILEIVTIELHCTLRVGLAVGNNKVQIIIYELCAFMGIESCVNIWKSGYISVPMVIIQWKKYEFF